MATDTYRTIVGRARAEIVEKKSRFIGHIAHVETDEQACAFIDEVKAAHRTARHNVYAYVLRNGRVRYSDDAEPSGTAGLPTLEVLQHASMMDVALVTTRYFGGVLLGTGGLTRAYTDAAKVAVQAATVVGVAQCSDIVVRLAYSFYEQLQRLMSSAGAQLLTSDFADDVTLTVRVRAGGEDNFVRNVTELTHGSAIIEVGDVVDAPWQE